MKVPGSVMSHQPIKRDGTGGCQPVFAKKGVKGLPVGAQPRPGCRYPAIIGKCPCPKGQGRA